MNAEKKLVETIVEGIQEKKGHGIVIADLSKIDGTICKYFVICHGNSPQQVEAIAGVGKRLCSRMPRRKTYQLCRTRHQSMGGNRLRRCACARLYSGNKRVLRPRTSVGRCCINANR